MILIRVLGVWCRISNSVVSYLYVNFSGLICLVGEKIAIFLLSFKCNYVVSDRRSFLFLLVLGIGCVILLWLSLDLPYNYFKVAYVHMCM